MLLALLAGCQFASLKVGDTGDTGAGDTADTSGDTGDTAAEVRPEVVSVDRLDCVPDETYGETWYIELTADDPQGADTVLIGSITVLGSDGQVLAGYGLDCWDGACDAYFRAEYDGLTCAMAPGLTFVFAVQDEDGNWSEPWYRAAG